MNVTIDLNDLAFFSHVVANGGFAAAARAVGIPKSKLSRRVAGLEEALGVRLIERSSRRFRVTDVGQAFYERCRNVLVEVEQAQAVVSEARGEPQGLVRVSCPTGLLGSPFAEAVHEFMALHPKVKVALVATNRRVDLIEERIDIALRVRVALDDDTSLVMRRLRNSRRILVCSPRLAKTLTKVRHPRDLAGVPTLTMAESVVRDRWQLVGPRGESFTLVHEPRLGSADLAFLADAAARGLGIALQPDHITEAARARGTLVQLLPGWHAEKGIIHLVYTTRRGQLPAVRTLIDHLASRFAAGAS